MQANMERAKVENKLLIKNRIYHIKIFKQALEICVNKLKPEYSAETLHSEGEVREKADRMGEGKRVSRWELWRQK